ncbi:MAG: diversity-generating retroelement protein Avd [Candidatus Falkowbacteria bacterium]
MVILKEKEAYQYWLVLHRNFPRTERFSIGQKISQTLIEVLELSFTASYLSLEQKLVLLTKASSRLDVLKFFVQLAWESKLIPTEKYIELSKKLEEIGRMLGGWRKGLLQKKTLTR